MNHYIIYICRNWFAPLNVQNCAVHDTELNVLRCFPVFRPSFQHNAWRIKPQKWLHSLDISRSMCTARSVDIRKKQLGVFYVTAYAKVVLEKEIRRIHVNGILENATRTSFCIVNSAFDGLFSVVLWLFNGELRRCCFCTHYSDFYVTIYWRCCYADFKGDEGTF